ncbi:unnamed protein product [Paramecium pentaurelia]|nr:unnamed protein product [Paramecium pentaurelia]
MKNTSLIGGNFVSCNLSGSEFDYVDISGLNLNGAQLFNCKWKNIKVHEFIRLDGHEFSVMSVCFSPDGNTLAFGSDDNSIRLWNVKTGQQIKSSDKNYKDILAQFTIPLQQHSHIQQASNYITTLLISQKAVFQAQGALILKGEFIDQSGIGLKTLFKQKGSCFIEDLQKK